MSSNYFNYNNPEPCPYCAAPCHADFVDVGVGMVQCGPYHCTKCGASEIGPELQYEDKKDENGFYAGPGEIKNREMFSDIEIETNWYEPKSGKISPYANTINGVLVDHKTAKAAYDVGLLDEKNI
ncbi:hypothetical protein SAMN04487895_101530 [Paenibacillus sophorae]|uniref:Uncharacterized protein n=1 Tax=Paenibacillus sophorae TaxID=1333845 RepID=A0A1H8GJ72_9BACL|nr:hypothetical protein [Paenibacillus sophorae]QWU14240.1 hypothetical protein KP014_20225 [Paenibacillus sophorae]SEN43830.1 hypothetical protein SAMN04487895_101530 [Paenibacillus sophorae]